MFNSHSRKRTAFLKALKEILPYLEDRSKVEQGQERIVQILNRMKDNVQCKREGILLIRIIDDLLPGQKISIGG